jgi:hypothetical protein
MTQVFLLRQASKHLFSGSATLASHAGDSTHVESARCSR